MSIRLLLPKLSKLTLLLAVCLISNSCGIIRVRNSYFYKPGSPVEKGYTPKGIVEEVIYHSSDAPGPQYRRMIVYLPADYYTSGKRYPVLYLLHGARGHETSWIKKGHVFRTTDSLFASGKAKPCIVVMPNMNQYNNQKDMEGGRLKDSFESIFEFDGKVEEVFIKDVVNLVDSTYNTIADRNHRAIAGLSVGGCQTIYLSANFPESFGYVASMSPYMYPVGRINASRLRFYSRLYPKLDRQFRDYTPKGYYLYAGRKDMMRMATRRIDLYLIRKKYPHSYKLYPGGHNWEDGWIDEYGDFLEKLFKEEESEKK